jgi:hypothetical protein
MKSNTPENKSCSQSMVATADTLTERGLVSLPSVDKGGLAKARSLVTKFSLS